MSNKQILFKNTITKVSSLTEETTIYKNQLNQWIQTLGLPQYQPSSTEIEAIIGLTKEKLRERSSVQLSEDAVMLSQYSFFLQQKANECQTFLTWTKQIGNRISEDDRHTMILWTRKAELRNTRIAYLARKIEVLGQSIANLVRSRYNEGGH